MMERSPFQIPYQGIFSNQEWNPNNIHTFNYTHTPTMDITWPMNRCSLPQNQLACTEYKGNLFKLNKRKSTEPIEGLEPSKVFISEEKMAQKMSGMTISDFTPTSNNNNNLQVELMDDENMDGELGGSHMKSLVFCDELSKMTNDVSCYLPQPVYHSQDDSRALVLWQPPSMLSTNSYNNDEEECNDSSVVITDVTEYDVDNNNVLPFNNNNLNTNNFPNVTFPDAMEL